MPLPPDNAQIFKALCERVIVIDQGRLVYDGTLAELVRRYADDKLIVVDLERPIPREALAALGELTEWEPTRATLRIRRADVPERAARLLAELPVADLAIQEPDVEDVIRELFGGETPAFSRQPSADRAKG